MSPKEAYRAQRYVILPAPEKDSEEWLWQLRSREGKVLLRSPRYPSERAARRAAKEDAQRRLVVREPDHA